MKALFPFLLLILVGNLAICQNIGIGTENPQEQLHLKTTGDDNTQLLLESADSVTVSTIPGDGLPVLYDIYRTDRFDQGLRFYPDGLEIHTGWGKQFINGPYVPYPSLRIDDLGRVGIGLNSAGENPSQRLEVKGRIKIANDFFADEAGVMRWDGNKFMGYDGNNWISFQDVQDADGDTKIELSEGAKDSLILQTNSASTQLIFDGTRLSYTGDNLFIGNNAGAENISGLDGNTMIGDNSGMQLSSGAYNTALGISSGKVLTTGNFNTLLGGASGGFVTDGDRNTMMGYLAGGNNNGDGNVFIGHQAGRFENGNNKLYISNSNSSFPLIKGDFWTKVVSIYNDLEINDDIHVNDVATARQVVVNDLNPQVKFNSSGNTAYDITYDQTNDRLSITDNSSNTSVHIKDGELYLPEYASSGERALRVDANGKVIKGGSYTEKFNHYDFYDFAVLNGTEFTRIGIHLEDDVTINSIGGYCWDTYAGGAAEIILGRTPKFSTSFTIEEIFSIQTTPSSSVILYSDSTPNSNFNVVDNDQYIYHLYYKHEYVVGNPTQRSVCKEIMLDISY